MSYHFSYYTIPLIAAAMVSAGVMLYAWWRRPSPSAVFLGNMGLAITIWALGYALEIAGADLPTKVFWGKFQYLGIVYVPMAWVVFAYFHVHPGKLPRPLRMSLLSIMPTLTILLAFTTERHGLIWKTVAIQQADDFSVLAVTHGVWFWINLAYTYVLLLAGTYLLARSLGRLQGLYRGQMIALIIALVAPWIGNALYIFGLSPIPYLDLTPFAFTISVVAGSWGIFGYQLVKLSPIARDLLVEGMPEGMIIIDAQGHVADINPAAGRMIGIPGTRAMGKSLGEVFAPWPEFAGHFEHSLEGQDQLAVGQGESLIVYDVRVSALRDQPGNLLGRMILIRANNPDLALPPVKRYAEAPTQPIQAATQAQAAAQPLVERTTLARVRGWLSAYFRTPLRADLPVPADVDPKWYQVRERSFTLILRIIALVGSVALGVVSAPGFVDFPLFPFFIILGLIWALALVRQLDFNLRVAIFLSVMYIRGLIELYDFGYSPVSFMLFITLVVAAALLLGRSGARMVLFLAVTSLAAFGVQIGTGHYLPVHAFEGVPSPATLKRAIAPLLIFTASGVGLMTLVAILMESLNKAWQMETQARHLLQQERDLLDLRITERTRDLAQARDEAVKNSDELRKYYLAMEQSGGSIVITDAQGNIEYVNPKFTEMTGYSIDEVRGQNPRLLKSGEHDLAFYQNLWQTIGSGQIWQGEIRNRRKDGSLFWELTTIAPVLNHRDEIANYIALKDDITARRDLQEQLALARDQALEASQLKSQLLSRISHELRTPLGSVLGYAELLRDSVLGPINAEQKDASAQIVHSANYLVTLVNDLLDAARIESKKLSLTMDYFTLQVLLDQVEARMAVLAQKKGLALSVEPILPLPQYIYGDEKRIQQVLVNLIGNAIKFTDQGCVTVKIYQPGPTNWCMQISDTGVGIPKEAQEYIFEPFRQVSNERTYENRGTGLGLSIVKQLVIMMDGMITVDSEPDQGSTFTVTLPIIIPEAAPA